MLNQNDTNSDDMKQPLTRGEFQDYVKTASKIFTNKEDLRELKDELTDNITKFKNEILTSNDKVIKKLDIVISELPSINEKQREHTNRIETLETKTRHIQARLGI